MVSGFLSETTAPVAVRRPVFDISFGSGGGGGGLLGAAGGALGIEGSQDPWQTNMVSFYVNCAVAPSVDISNLLLMEKDQAHSVVIEDAGSISLGYEDSSTDLVFTAEVDSIRHDLRGTLCIGVVNGGARLSKLRVNQSYEQQNAGDIVADLISQAGVDSEIIEDGITFPFYVVDDRKNSYQHIAALAKTSGFAAFFTPEDKLYFGPLLEGEPVQTFSYAIDIMTIQMNEVSPLVDNVTIIGAGAAGSQGQEAWSWLVKDPSSVTGQAGDGEHERLLSNASLRSGEASQAAVDAIINAAAQTLHTGRITVPGAPAVVIGSSIEISDAPQEMLNGTCVVRGIQHCYSKHDGFISIIDFTRAGEGGLSGGLGALL